jgi:hypothetical protein
LSGRGGSGPIIDAALTVIASVSETSERYSRRPLNDGASRYTWS